MRRTATTKRETEHCRGIESKTKCDACVRCIKYVFSIRQNKEGQKQKRQ